MTTNSKKNCGSYSQNSTSSSKSPVLHVFWGDFWMAGFFSFIVSNIAEFLNYTILTFKINLNLVLWQVVLLNCLFGLLVTPFKHPLVFTLFWVDGTKSLPSSSKDSSVGVGQSGSLGLTMIPIWKFGSRKALQSHSRPCSTSRIQFPLLCTSLSILDAESK